MNVQRLVLEAVSRTETGRKAVGEARDRVLWTAAVSLFFNLSYAVYHGALGVLGHSWWLLALCAYYLLLAMMRFSIVLCARKNGAEPAPDAERRMRRESGALLLLLSCVLAGVNAMSMAENIANQYGEIAMIAVAAYTFAKLGAAVIRAVKHRRSPSALPAAVRRIGLAEGAASVLTLQRSMLVSFGGMAAGTRTLMNALTGAGVCLFVLVLGIVTIKESGGRSMAKSKLANANERIAEKAAGASRKIEEAVVGGYNRIEKAVVGGYAKVEDAFVGRYLTRAGETVAAAKERLKQGRDAP